MAVGNTKKFVVKNGLRTQNIDFVSPDSQSVVTQSISNNGVLSFDGVIEATSFGGVNAENVDYNNSTSGLAATDVQAAVNELAAEEVIVFPAGTRMLFQQTSAPTGWTKVTTGIDNRALRVVTGTAGSGGANAFTTAFNSARTTSLAGGHGHTVTVNNHTLSIAQIPSHNHTRTTGTGYRNATSNHFTFRSQTTNATRAGNSTGGSGAHNHGASVNNIANHAHTLNLDVQYLDVIVAAKD